MAELSPAIRDESKTATGQIVGNVAQTVFMDGKPIVLEGSVNSAGATVVKPPVDRGIYVENRMIAVEGDLLSDGSVILPRKK